jgi:tyrosine-protein kinase Etk/Wzc
MMQKPQELLVPNKNTAASETVALNPVDSAKPGSSLVDVCLRRWKTVVTIPAICVVIATVYLCFATKIYTSTCRLYVEANAPHLIGEDSQSTDSQSEAYLFRQCQVIRAEPILRQALAENPLAVDRMFHGVTDPLPALLKNLSVDVGKKDEIITVELSSAYPVESATLLNSIVSCYESFQSRQTRSTATEGLNILQREKDSQEKLLDQKLKEIVAFKQKNGEMFFTNEKGMNILTQNLATISEQLTQAKLDAITARVHAVNASNLITARHDIRVADEEVAGYENEFEAEKQKALAINAAQAEFQKMQLQADRTTRLCDLLDSRIKELDVSGNSGSMNIQVLEVAKAEDHPTSPKKTMTLLAAMAFGLALGGGLAVIGDRMDQRIRAPDEAAHLLGMPVLGVIPARFSRGPEDRSKIGCAVNDAPTSALADAFTAMAVSLHVAWPKEDVKTLLVTSPNRGDGKSTTCSNLAIAMATAGRKTLLIDADLRRPVQHEIFGKLNAVGVSDVVAHGMYVDRAIQKTGIEGLSLLACGALPPNPSEIVRGQAFTQMVEALQEQYDLIIIDSPPILAAPDARILGAQADVALLVLRSGRSTRQDADHAAKSLRGVGANLVGLVFNGVPQGRSSYYYEEDDVYRSPETPARARRIEGKVVVEGESLVY